MSELHEQLIDLLNAEAIFLRQQLAEERLRRAETLAMCDQLTVERDEAVRIAKELMEPSPVTEDDVKWAQDMLAAQQHQEGLP